MFRSVRFYTVLSPWPDSEQALSERLATAAFRPCGPYSERSSGFEPPADGVSVLARRVAGADLLKLRSQVRVLPAAAVNEALEARIEEYRGRMGEEPGRRMKRKLKQQTRDELLPKALVKSDRTLGLYIEAEQTLAVATASETRAERFLDHLRAALGSLEAKPLAYKRPFADLLARAFAGDAPGFELGRECRMRDPADPVGAVRWQNVDLGQANVQRCFKDGLELTHLGIEFGRALSAVIDANGVLGKLKLAGEDEPPRGADPAPGGDEDRAQDSLAEALARLDADIALLAGTLRELLAAFRRVLGGQPAAEPAILPRQAV